MVDHAASHKLDIIEEAISVYEQVLRLRPSGHERRAEAASDLGDALFLFCLHHRADESRAHWSLELLREVVLLRPPGHPLRGRSLHILAKALFFVNYGQGSGDLLALTESILLNREALQLRPINHPERANSLSNLGAALMEYFKRYGDLAFIEESICVNREALQLWGPGHPLRDAALTNLAAALHEFTSHQGGLEVLAEVDSLLREALDQCPPGHPMRYQALENLSGSLQNRFELQGLPAALSEAIALRRQACELIPANHPDGWRPRNNLAWSLTADFRSQRDLSTITEAITLLRQALLGRHGNPVRHILLDSLAEALLAHFTEFKDTAYLIEAIDLQRDVLLLCPRGHTHRPKALHRLAHMLSRPECQSWSEALTLFSEAKECCPAGHPSRALLSSDMSKCFLDPASPFFDLAKGISHLSEGYSNELSHVNQRLGQAVSDLRQLEMAFMHAMREADASTRDPLSSHVLDLYIQAVGLLPRAANFGLDHKLRLQVITGSDEISRNAAARAIFRGQSSQAIEILEEGRGIFWSQTLHLRETRFDGVPEGDRRTMLRLLGMLAHGAQEAGSLAWTEAQREEASERRRQLNEEAEALISRIRAYPGCTRFMLPAVFENLLNGLPDGYVVILNASSLGYHALLLQKATGLAASLELELPSTGFHIAALRAQIPRDMIVQTEQKSKDDVPSRAMRLNSGKAFSFDVVLSQLWASMVQPVIRMMNLGVSASPISISSRR
jgi:tetratricopeptide (TPR) repeat protein